MQTIVSFTHSVERWRNQKQEMKNPEDQLPRYVKDRQAFDSDLRHRKGQIQDGWRIGQILKVTDKEATKRMKSSVSKEDIIEGQRLDPDLKVIRTWLEKDLKPDWQEISRHGPTVKGYWLQWDSLHRRDDLITRKWKSPDGKRFVYQRIVPNSCKENVLLELLDSHRGGHFGVNQTLARIRFYWINFRKDVEEWCKRCDQCSVKKGSSTIHELERDKLKLSNDRMKMRLDHRPEDQLVEFIQSLTYLKEPRKV